MAITGFSEMTLQARDPAALAGFSGRAGAQAAAGRDRARRAARAHGGDRALYVRDPEGNVVEAWDLFERGRTVHSLRDAAA